MRSVSGGALLTGAGWGLGFEIARALADRGYAVHVTDIDEARAELAGRGMEVSEVDVQPWGSFVYFSDPDGNSWAVQQLPPRAS